MARLSSLALVCVLTAISVCAQAPAPREQEPPEEDVSLEKVPEYTLNPLQAEKELEVGKYYFKRGSFKAAARRFEEATKWNPGLAEAWLRLGDAQSRVKDAKAARAAYEKFLELNPSGRDAESVRKRLKSKAS